MDRRSSLLTLLAAACPGAWAQVAPPAYRLTVTARPGGSIDLLGRTLAAAMQEGLGVPMTVFNVEGASGELALRRLKSEPADGSHWLLAQESVLTINPSFFPRPSAQVLDDIVPVALVARSHFYLLVRAESAVANFPVLLARAREASVPLTFASGGVGTLHHLAVEDLAQRLKLRLTHVPYKSPTQAVQALMGGEVDFLAAGASSLALVTSGKLRMLGVTQRTRMRDFPDVPALSEFSPGFEAANWFGLFARQGVPAARIEAMRTQLQLLAERPEVARSLVERANMSLSILAGPAFEQLILRDHERYKALVQRLGLKPEIGVEAGAQSKS